MSYPTALPTRTTGLDPEGIGAAKTNLTPLNEAERAQRIPEDEYNRVLDAVVAICAILGEDGSVDPAALRVQVATLSGTQVVTSSPDTINADVTVVAVTNTATTTLNVPPAVAGKRILIVKAHSAAYRVDLAPDGTDTINGANATWSSFDADQNSYRAAVGLVATADGAWDTDGEDLGPAAYEFAQLLDSRVNALEAIATTPLSSTTGTTLSWEAQERVRLANTGTTHCLVTLNGDTTEWPVGRARALSQYGSTTGGFTLAVPSGHKLNTVTNGTSGIIGTTPADDGTALYTVMVTREASDAWGYAITAKSTIATGDIADGAITTAKIGSNAVSSAQLRQSVGTSVIGRNTGSAGDPADITAAVDDRLLGRSGGVLAFIQLTIGMIADGLITRAKLANATALSVIGRSANSTGAPADIAASNDGEVLRRSGTTLGFGTIVAAGIATDAVTTAKILASNVTMSKLAAWPAASIYRSTAQAIAHNTQTLVQCSSATFTATGGSDAPTVDLVNYRVTITRAGLYRVSGRLGLTPSNSTGVIVVYLFVNGASRALTSVAATASRLTVVHVSELIPLVATDFVDLRIYQDSGVSQNTGTAVDQCPQIQVEYVGPTA